jgi:hypothetical protein
MIHKAYIILLLFVICFFYSCNRDKKDVLIRNWHAVKLENPKLDDMIQQQLHFIDTVGTTTANTNIQLYGTNNIDSLKKALKIELDSFIMLQKNAFDNTWFNFKKNGTASLTFNGVPDSVKWHFDNEGSLILEESESRGVGGRLSMEVVQLSDTVLKLRFVERDINSIITFQPQNN